MDPGASSPEKLDKENLVGKFIFPALSLFYVYYTKWELYHCREWARGGLMHIEIGFNFI